MRLISSILLIAALIASAACNRNNGDRLTDDDIAAAAGVKDEEQVETSDARCTSARTHDAIKRELFRRAAEIRGSNAESYARISDFAVFQVVDAAPVAPSSAEEAVECRGRATLRLPPNLGVAGGRTSLLGSIGFSVGRMAKGAAPVVSLTDDEAITIPLATLSQKRASTPSSTPVAEPRATEPASDPLAPTAAALPPPPPAPPVVAAEPAPPRIRPSFDCRSARTRGEIAVCSSASLANLDQAMAAQYRSAVANADPAKARLLRETRDRFLGYRDRCPDEACIATTYRGRMREISDIVAGRWRGR